MKISIILIFVNLSKAFTKSRGYRWFAPVPKIAYHFELCQLLKACGCIFVFPVSLPYVLPYRVELIELHQFHILCLRNLICMGVIKALISCPRCFLLDTDGFVIPSLGIEDPDKGEVDSPELESSKPPPSKVGCKQYFCFSKQNRSIFLEALIASILSNYPILHISMLSFPCAFVG